MDRLTLKGLGPADGSYDFDLSELVSINGPSALNLREQQRIKLLSGYRGLEIREAIAVLDPAMMVSLVSVLVSRGAKTVSEQRVWDAKMVYTSGEEVADLEPYRIAVNFHMDELAETDETVDPAETGDGQEVEVDPEA